MRIRNEKNYHNMDSARAVNHLFDYKERLTTRDVIAMIYLQLEVGFQHTCHFDISDENGNIDGCKLPIEGRNEMIKINYSLDKDGSVSNIQFNYSIFRNEEWHTSMVDVYGLRLRIDEAKIKKIMIEAYKEFYLELEEYELTYA